MVTLLYGEGLQCCRGKGYSVVVGKGLHCSRGKGYSVVGGRVTVL